MSATDGKMQREEEKEAFGGQFFEPDDPRDCHRSASNASSNCSGVTNATAISSCLSEEETVCGGASDDGSDAEDQAQVASTKPFSGGLAPPVPSVGSAGHHAGDCRPCVWFWKREGCQNGADCLHCHLCPKGEVRLRKKVKALSLHHDGSGGGLEPAEPKKAALQASAVVTSVTKSTRPHAAGASAPKVPSPPQQPPELFGTASDTNGTLTVSVPFRPPPGLPAPQRAVCFPRDAIHLVDDSKLGLMSRPTVTPQAIGIGSMSRAAEYFPWKQREVPRQEQVLLLSSQPIPAPPPPLPAGLGGVCLRAQEPPMSQRPSVGSALHFSGKCRPCMWLWGPEGCRNGQACMHCHLCPEGERKARRQAKKMLGKGPLQAFSEE